MITAQKVKELRERTGIGMSKCKQALEEASGDINLAIENLRKSGLASAVKKEGRETNEGLIGFAQNDSYVALVEINSETDFVAKNERFQEYLSEMAEEVIVSKPKDAEDFSSKPYSKDASLTIDQYRSTVIQVLGENIVIKKLKLIKKDEGHSFGVYSHMQGKIVCVVELNKSGFDALAKDVAMHVAAASPEYLSPKEVPAEIVDQEREIARSQMKGKPDHIIDKILEGKLQTFYGENCLTNQLYIKETSSKIKVEDVLKQADKDLKICNFIRWQVGG